MARPGMHALRGEVVLFGVRDEDGTRIRLGTAHSLPAGRRAAADILNASSLWREICIQASGNRKTLLAKVVRHGRRAG